MLISNPHSSANWDFSSESLFAISKKAHKTVAISESKLKYFVKYGVNGFLTKWGYLINKLIV